LLPSKKVRKEFRQKCNVPASATRQPIGMSVRTWILFIIIGAIPAITFAQGGIKKSDSMISARQIILRNSGESNLPKQLKQRQLKKHPESLNRGSINKPAALKRRQLDKY